MVKHQFIDLASWHTVPILNLQKEGEFRLIAANRFA